MFESSTSKSKKDSASNSNSSKTKDRRTTPSSSADKNKKVEITKVSETGNNIQLAAKNIPEQAEIQVKALNGEKAWIQISDTNQTALYTGTVQASNPYRQKLVEGMQQFSIIVGAPANTELTINGEKVDMASYNSGMVLNFTVSLEYAGENTNTSPTSSNSSSSSKTQQTYVYQ
jgi:hypothetical protein